MKYLIIAIGAGLMTLATVVYITHRRTPVSAPLYSAWDYYSAWDEADGMCPNCVTPWKCNGPHEPDYPPYFV